MAPVKGHTVETHRRCSVCIIRLVKLAPIVKELFGHFVDPAWHVATDCGPEGHAIETSSPLEAQRGTNENPGLNMHQNDWELVLSLLARLLLTRRSCFGSRCRRCETVSWEAAEHQASQSADQSLDVRVLPRRAGSEPPPPIGAVVVGSAGATASAASSRSPIVQTRSVRPKATAGVVRRASWTRHML
jgi:hypothetical protein